MMKLVQNEVLFTHAFQHSPTGLGLVSMDGIWLKVNPFLCSLTGYSEEELLYTAIQMITYPDDVDYDLSHIQHLLDGNMDSYQVEKRYVHKQGNPIWVKLTVSLIRDELGNPLHYMVHIQDLTERNQSEHDEERLKHTNSHRKLLEEELRISNERIQNILKAAKIGTAIADIECGRFIKSTLSSEKF